MDTLEEAITSRIEGVFKHIHETRMRDIPILNSALNVELVGLEQWKGMWLAMLITPWFMNLILMPEEQDAGAWTELAPGSTVSHDFPDGPLSFIVATEEGLGTYQSCSMFSPVFEFTEQKQAVETAQAILMHIKAEAAPATDKEEELAQPSRRRMFGMQSRSLVSQPT